MRPKRAARFTGALGLIALAFTTACDDDFGPVDWDATPDTVDLYSWVREEYRRLPTGYDLLSGRHGQRVAVDDPGSSGNWDFALLEGDDELILLPAGALTDLGATGAGILTLSELDFEGVTKVPGGRDTYLESDPVTAEVGRLYALRSRRYYGIIGQDCHLYGLLRPISIDLAEGILRFEVIRNPNCNDRSMVPPK